MRVFLTGATGFLGSYVLRRLLASDNEVAILTRANSNTWRISSLLERVTQITGDFSSPAEISASLREFAPEVTIHLAWEGVGGKYRNDLRQIETNLLGSTKLLTTVTDAGCKAWVGLGSQAEYGPANAKIDEEYFPHPTTLYGASKLSTYLLSKQLCEQRGIRFAWLRLFSAYGPMDDPNCMIPGLINRLLAKEHIALTEGTQMWDYIHIEDAAEAVYQAAVNDDAQGTFNLGSGEVQSIREIALQVRDLIDPSLNLGFGEVPFNENQVMHLQANISRLQSALGWNPNVELNYGLKQTVDWYREHRIGE